jgi:hypothetical protein
MPRRRAAGFRRRYTKPIQACPRLATITRLAQALDLQCATTLQQCIVAGWRLSRDVLVSLLFLTLPLVGRPALLGDLLVIMSCTGLELFKNRSCSGRHALDVLFRVLSATPVQRGPQHDLRQLAQLGVTPSGSDRGRRRGCEHDKT